MVQARAARAARGKFFSLDRDESKKRAEEVPFLVGGFKHFLFSIIYGIILPIDFHMFQRGSNHQPGLE
jgi:hypothetical protein